MDLILGEREALYLHGGCDKKGYYERIKFKVSRSQLIEHDLIRFGLNYQTEVLEILILWFKFLDLCLEQSRLRNSGKKL